MKSYIWTEIKFQPTNNWYERRLRCWQHLLKLTTDGGSILKRFLSLENVEEDYICELTPQLSPSIDKLQIVIKQMKNIKSPEIDDFPYAENCENFPLARIFELVILMCKNGDLYRFPRINHQFCV